MSERFEASFPIHYKVSYKPYRAQNYRYAKFAAEATLSFRRVARGDVRPVMRLVSVEERDRSWGFDAPTVPKADAAPREVVEFEGELWIEAVAAAAVVDGLEKRSGKGTPFVERYGDGALTVEPPKTGELPDPYANRRPEVMQSRHELERYERSSLSEFNDDGGEAMRAGLKRTADALIEIDGMLYARFREPAVAMSGWGETKNLGFCAAGNGAERYETRGRRRAVCDLPSIVTAAPRWSLSEIGTALAEYERSTGDKAASAVVCEILDAETLTACPHVAGCLELADQALEALWRHPLALRPGVIDEAVELRDAIVAASGQLTPRLRRALAAVAAIEPLTEESAAIWRRRAEGRPHARHWHGHGNAPPLTRAGQVVAHDGDHVEAARHAEAALRRLAIRNRRLSWEERALDLEETRIDGACCRELLSSQAVAACAEALGVDRREAIRAARDEGARIFAVEADREVTWFTSAKRGRGREQRSATVSGPTLLAIVDEGPDGTLSVRRLLHGKTPPSAAQTAMLDRHLARAPVAEPILEPGMRP